MPKQNAYLARRAAIESEKNKNLIRIAIRRDCTMWMLALNREYGFGKDRLNHLRATVLQLYNEYGEAAKTDYEYGDELIDREIRKIMGYEK